MTCFYIMCGHFILWIRRHHQTYINHTSLARLYITLKAFGQFSPT